MTENYKPAKNKNIPSSFKRLWALQVPCLQNKVIGVNGVNGVDGVIGVNGVNGVME